jgi:Skp family chaperone for outer membrane proteins
MNKKKAIQSLEQALGKDQRKMEGYSEALKRKDQEEKRDLEWWLASVAYRRLPAR